MADSAPQPDGTDTAQLYNALPFDAVSKCIRILEVEAPSPYKADGGSIRGELRIVDLNDSDAAPFTALTYVWGEKAETPDTIICSGQSIEVTSNCHAALLHLRRKLGAFRIWIDAISINQRKDATHEKMEQITLMGEIYSLAETVYVWLGEGSPATARAMQYLQVCGFQEHFRGDGESKLQAGSWSAIRACLWDKLNPTKHPFPLDKPARGRLSRLLNRDAPYALFSDVSALLDVEWIRRMWTFQEIILARNPIVVRGDEFVPWDRLARGIVFLEFSGVNHHQKTSSNGRPRIPVLETWAKVALCRDQLQHKNGKKRLEMSSDPVSNTSSDILEIPRPVASLLRYQNFALKFSQNLVVAKSSLMIIAFLATTIICLSTYAFSFVVMSKTNDTALEWSQPEMAQVEQISNASVLLAACGKRCLHNMTAEACHTACAAAKDAQGNIPDLSFQRAESYKLWTDLWPNIILWAICALVVLVSFLCWILHKKIFANIRPVLHPEGSKMDLASAICSRAAVEQRDKAFALQAILQRLMDKELPVPETLRSLEEIFEELTLRIIEATDSLHFLVAAAMHGLPGRPSWIPDWSAKYDQYWIQPPLVGGEPQNATPGSRPYWRTIPTNSSLFVVRGVWQSRLARVVRFEDKNDHAAADREVVELRNVAKLFSLCDSCQTQLGFDGAVHPFDIEAKTRALAVLPSLARRQNWALGIFLAVMHGERAEGIPFDEPDQRTALLLQYFRRRAGTRRRFRQLLWDNTRFYWRRLFIPTKLAYILWISLTCSLGDVLKTSTEICDTLAYRRKAFFTMRIAVANKRFTDRRWDEYLKAEEQTAGATTTTAGAGDDDDDDEDNLDNEKAFKWIGVCEYSAQVGDDVVLVSGVRTPLIMRRGEHSTKLVSPACVDGMSKGQRWLQNSGKGDLDEFFIS